MKLFKIHQLAYFFALTLLAALFFHGTLAKAATDTITIIQDNTGKEYKSSPLNIQYNGTTYSNKLAPVKINSIWMIPSKDFFFRILGCSYQNNNKTQEIIIKNPDRTTKLVLTQNSNTAMVNSVSQQMPLPVLQGQVTGKEASDDYVPLEFVLKALGYTYTINNSTLTMQSNYIYTISAEDLSFPQNKYENALEGITIGKNSSNSQNFILGLTSEPAYDSELTYIPNAQENSITMKFLHTKNALGAISKDISNGIILSIKVWEENTTTYLKIFYNRKYIYTQHTDNNGGKITLSKGSYSMKIMLPDNVSFSKITTTDQYWNRKFLIVIPGNHINFYKKYTPIKNSSAIKGYSLAKTASGNTRITVSTSGLKGYKLQKGNGYFTVKVGSPKSIYKNIVMLDAGHGGKDSGARSSGVKEKSLNLNILYKQAKKYFESTTSTVKAYWTRHNDTFIHLYSRPKYSKKYSADLFVSLHMNSSPSKRSKGTEVYYSKANKKSMSGLNSKMFAARMCSTLVKDLKTKRRGVRQAGFVVIKYNTVPSILIELGFLSNSSDRRKLKQASFQKKAAKSIYRGIASTFKAYPTNR